MFEKEIQSFIKKSINKVNNVTQETSAELGSRLVDKTPVDTGHAKANWRLTIGKLDTNEIDAVDPSGGRAKAVIKSMSEQINMGDNVYVSNSVPYINRLEHGHSKQAPQGMRNTTIAEFQGIVKEKARRNK